MNDPISLPFWLFLILLLLAAFGLLEKLLLPSVRWFFRRRFNRAIDAINQKLQIEIQPFKLTRRQSLIDRLRYDSHVLAAVDAYASDNKVPRDLALARVRTYAREIVPSFNAYLYFRVAYWLAKKIAQAIYRVRLGYADDEALRQVPPNASVVFLINHRSNMDYILVTYFAASRTALSYAVGEWARIWPLQSFIRALGAYFVRRRSNNPLYRKVLERYVQIATQEGVTQAVFLEGGLTRDGQLQAPRLGILDYLLRNFDPENPRDLVFIPVGINYDRTLEDRTLLMEKGSPEKKGMGAAAGKTIGFLWKNLVLMARGNWHRFGYACVNFGTPISVKDYLTNNQLDLRRLTRDDRFRQVAVLAEHLMARIGSMVPVLPVSVVALVLTAAPEERLDELTLKARVNDCLASLAAAGAQIYIPRQDMDYAVNVGLRMLVLRRLVLVEEGLYRIDPAELPVLAYYANALVHFKS